MPFHSGGFRGSGLFVALVRLSERWRTGRVVKLLIRFKMFMLNLALISRSLCCKGTMNPVRHLSASAHWYTDLTLFQRPIGPTNPTLNFLLTSQKTACRLHNKTDDLGNHRIGTQYRRWESEKMATLAAKTVVATGASSGLVRSSWLLCISPAIDLPVQSSTTCQFTDSSCRDSSS